MFLVNKHVLGVFDKPYNGVLGLARADQPYFLLPDKLVPDRKFFIVENLGLTHQSFITHFSSSGTPFNVDFGVPDVAGDGAKIEVANDYFWSSWMQGVRIGEERENTFGFESSK